MAPADRQYRLLHHYTKALSVALGYRDLYTRVHSDRVHALASATAERAGLSEQEVGVVSVAAMFHDVGKIGVPDRVLLKPDLLTRDEMAEMQAHAEVGAAIILSTELDGSDGVSRAIRSHHECWDGGGYPDGTAGEDIPLASRIIGIADSYDAMALTRPYRRAKSHREIVAILQAESGQKHDPAILGIFLDAVEQSEFRSRD